METLLSVHNLKIGLVNDGSATELVRGISFDVHEGEIVALVDESGSGKSLTALSAPRLLPSNIQILDGEINFAGNNLVRLSDRDLHAIRGRELGMIFQDSQSALNPTLTIGKQIIKAIRARQKCSKSEAWKQAVTSLEAVGIAAAESRMRAYPHELSGGMQQRVMIAMAVQGSPKLIIIGCPFEDRCPRALPQCAEAVPPRTTPEIGHRFYCYNPEPVLEETCHD